MWSICYNVTYKSLIIFISSFFINSTYILFYFFILYRRECCVLDTNWHSSLLSIILDLCYISHMFFWEEKYSITIDNNFKNCISYLSVTFISDQPYKITIKISHTRSSLVGIVIHNPNILGIIRIFYISYHEIWS